MRNNIFTALGKGAQNLLIFSYLHRYVGFFLERKIHTYFSPQVLNAGHFIYNTNTEHNTPFASNLYCTFSSDQVHRHIIFLLTLLLLEKLMIISPDNTL